MSPGNLTFNCVDFNKMSIERAFYCNSVAGLNARASLIIKVICLAQVSSFIVDELRESVEGGCSLDKTKMVNGSHNGFFSPL